ncbi:MAG: preprotein translocase subunit YajC [Alphaproteobacteria bacterium]|nr:preprotein translocase subunit YajC [Alphaproteobacteria bacterium]
MLISDAFAQTGAPAGAPDATTALLMQLFPFAIIFVVFYFLMIRPQQRRLSAHRDMIANLKRGDVVVTSGGLIGKIKSVADDEVRVELATNVEVRVIRSTITDVRTKGEPAPANDSKPAKAE